MVSILITHYNRIEALKTCLAAFRNLKLPSVEFVVADDNSDPQVKKQLISLDLGKLVLSDKNTGLASNLNRGLKACSGDFILYCQEDFIPKKDLITYIKDAQVILKTEKADMCRLRANYKFPKLNKLSENFDLIPKFALENFYFNTFQYSDNPFLTKKTFFSEFGFFLEDVSGAYGENEYAIRIMKSKANIAIAKKQVFVPNQTSKSVIMNEVKTKKKKINKKNKNS